MTIDKKSLAERFFGPTNASACVICKHEVDPDMEFKDHISKVEWGISQMCQSCQDNNFNTEDIDDDVDLTPEEHTTLDGMHWRNRAKQMTLGLDYGSKQDLGGQ